MLPPFPDPPALCGPLRRPRQTRVVDGETRAVVAEMILNHAVMKASYAAYDREAAELTGGTA